MKIIKFLKRDINNGILKRWYILLLPAFFAIVQIYQYNGLLESLRATNTVDTYGTVADYFLYCTKGMEVYHFNIHETFKIPIYWFAFQIGLSYFIAYYAYDDFVVNGRNLFIASKDRISWWISKCIWCLLSALIYYAVNFITIFAGALYFKAEASLAMDIKLSEYMYGYTMSYMSITDIWFISLLTPFCISAALCLFQILFGFFVSPVVSFAVMCSEYVLSAYYTCWYLIGNYTMWLRSSYYTDSGIVSTGGIVIAISIVLVCICIGNIYFNEKDIL